VLAIPNLKRPAYEYFSMASHNVGLGFSLTGALTRDCAAVRDCALTFGATGVAGATLGFSGSSAVEAYWNLTTKSHPTVSYYWSARNDLPYASYWHGPITVGAGINARLAGGPGGLFLLSQDFVGTESQPTRLDVRKWNPSTHRFAAPVRVVNDTSSAGSAAIGGLGEDTVTGALYVVWGGRSRSEEVVRLWTSTDGGAKWSAVTDVSKIYDIYGGPARLAVRKGTGYLTYDDGGLVEPAAKPEDELGASRPSWRAPSGSAGGLARSRTSGDWRLAGNGRMRE
jgi:hypothetical protein